MNLFSFFFYFIPVNLPSRIHYCTKSAIRNLRFLSFFTKMDMDRSFFYNLDITKITIYNIKLLRRFFLIEPLDLSLSL
ncbi:hypothetical protein RIF29_43196 [Crotalaria pallida]|uniref:Uncharacterized protein n=1 Tax=Crotalaria pallida TaxID=3830 RepID=A0AAN9DWU2_CROPI